MRKGSDLLGKLIVSYDTGESIARVVDLIFDQSHYALAGVLVSEGNWFNGAWVIDVENIMNIGSDALIVPNASSIKRSKKLKHIHTILKQNIVLKGTRIMTTMGTNLGSLIDFYFDDRTLAVKGYEVSGGLFADVYSGRSFVPAPKTLKIGKDFAFVPPEVADLMDEHVGGMKGSVLLASERLQEETGLVYRRLQEIAHLVTQKLYETATYTNQQVQVVVHQAVAAVMNSIVNPTEQKIFIKGRKVDRDILLPNGTVLIQDDQSVTDQIIAIAEEQNILDLLYVAVGGSVSDELSHRIQEVTESANQRLHDIMNQTVAAMMNSIVDPVEQRAFMIGKTVDEDILLSDGKLFIAQGTVITDDVVDQAQELMMFDQLYKTVGGSITNELSLRVQEATSSSKQTVQDVVKSSISGMMSSLIDPAERKTFMLGKTVDRDIFSAEGQLVISKGDIVTAQVVEAAQNADMLDQLFHAVGGSFALEVSQRVQEATDSTRLRLQTIVQQTMKGMTQGVMPPEDQKEFMLGKFVEYDVTAPDGTLLVTTGNPITKEIIAVAEEKAMLDKLYKSVGGSFVAGISQRARSILSKRVVNQTEGRRVRKEVRTSDDLIVAAMGQIVTQDVIELAREYGKEHALVEATGLSVQDVAHETGSSLLAGLSETGDRLRQGTSQVGSNVSNLVSVLEKKASSITQQSAEWLETQRIHRALGRPTTRVILDLNDRVILNVGELITHDSIERARQADVLGILLSSAYVKRPKLTTEEQRSPVPSLAALQ